MEILAHTLAAERREFLARSGVRDSLLVRAQSWLKREAQSDVDELATVIDVILNPAGEDDGIEMALKDRQEIESRLKILDRIRRKSSILSRFSCVDNAIYDECSLSLVLDAVLPHVPEQLREYNYRFAVERPLSLRRIMRALFQSLANDVKFRDQAVLTEAPRYDSLPVVSGQEPEAPPPSYASLFKNDFIRSEARVIQDVIASSKLVTNELISLMLSNFDLRNSGLLPDDYTTGAATRLAQTAREALKK